MRVATIEGLLRNRAMLIDDRGRPVALQLWRMFPGVVPSDEEFRVRAEGIVDALGDQLDGLEPQLELFEQELGRRLKNAEFPPKPPGD